jgi:hypothetical protein
MKNKGGKQVPNCVPESMSADEAKKIEGYVPEEVELDEGKANYTKILMKDKSVIAYVRKQQKYNKKEVSSLSTKDLAWTKMRNKDTGHNEPRYFPGSRWIDLAKKTVGTWKGSLDFNGEYKALVIKLGLDKFAPKFEANDKLLVKFNQFESLNAWGEVTEEDKSGKKLNNPTRGDVKKYKVYVKNDKGNVVKVEFGDPNMSIKRDDPARKKAFRARHNCDNPGPKFKARYWSCKFWSTKSVTDLMKG